MPDQISVQLNAHGSPRSLWRSLAMSSGHRSFCQDHSEVLECKARLITDELVQPRLDVDTFHH